MEYSYQPYNTRKKGKKKKKFIFKNPALTVWEQIPSSENTSFSTFQAPHDKEDEITDLTDDNAPDLPMSSSVQSSNQPNTSIMVTLTNDAQNESNEPEQVTNKNENTQSSPSVNSEPINMSFMSKKKQKHLMRLKKYKEIKLQKWEQKQKKLMLENKASDQEVGENPGSSGQNDSAGTKAQVSSSKIIVNKQSPQEKPKDALEDLPPEVKAVINDKLKKMPTTKTPIIMPPAVEEPVSDEVKNKNATFIPNSVPSLKPIEVRVLTENRFQNPITPEKKAAKKLKKKEAKAAQSQFRQRAPTVQMNEPMEFGLTYSYPKGIPKSFFVSSQREAELQQNTSQQQSNVNLPSMIIPSQNPYTEQSISFANAHNPNAPMLDQMSSTYSDNVHGFQPMFVQTGNLGDKAQAYSPSDLYPEFTHVANDNQDRQEGSESPNSCQSGQKRLSAFQRLGPLTQPKKPKLTINLMLNKEHSVREVVDETEDEVQNEIHYPVHLKPSILSSKDPTVIKHLPLWPWKKNVTMKKTVLARHSRSVMILEQEQMEDFYEKDGLYIAVTIKGYPPSWKKEDVLDAMLNSLPGRSFIPCFIEFKPNECKFLVIRSRNALMAIHKYGFQIIKDDVHLSVSISVTDLSMKHLDFMPRLVLRQILASRYDSERKLKLNGFTLQPDVSHFIYFPLSRVINQTDLLQIQSVVAWNYLTDLDLSCNKITTIEGFDFPTTTPRLKHLDLSKNSIQNVTSLQCCRNLPLHSLSLEGNPLCHNYVDAEHYVEVVKMIFPMLKEIDEVAIQLKGDMPKSKRNYCPEAAKGIVNKFLDVYFPLLDLPPEDRLQIQNLYDEDATMTITCKKKLRYGSVYRYFRNLFLRSRSLEDNETDSVNGAASIAKHLSRWPAFIHDPYTFTVDVFHHDDYSTVLRVGGILKVTAESLAEDEHVLAFNKTIVLHSTNGVEYKISNELVHWDVPVEEYANVAFQINMVKSRNHSLKLESAPDEDLKKQLVNIFMKLTEMEKKPSERCLETKDWNLKLALQHFIALSKLDSLHTLYLE